MTSFKDRRFGRLIEFDPRSRNYPVSRGLARLLPAKEKVWACPEKFDQGLTSACVGFAFGHELAAAPQKVKGLSNGFLERRIYWEAQKLDEFPGGEYPGAEAHFAGTSILAGAKRVQAMGFCSGYAWAFSVDDIVRGLQSGPCVIGVNWRNQMDSPDAEGFVRPLGKSLGGHAFCLLGVFPKEEYVLARNSWGDWYGLRGDFRIRFRDLATMLRDRGEAVFLTGRSSSGK